ncbi:MAG: SUMF1/EgtB/PvdO family nonheme iron enzyme [Polyangiales bacterium]
MKENTMQLENSSWARFLARALVLVVGVFGAVRLAVAGPGVAGGAPRTFVTVSGTITGMSGTQQATFHFRRAGMTTDLCRPQVDVAIADNGAFAVQVPLDDATSPCPATTFNGSDVVVDVDLPGVAGVVRDANVNPVPYAIYAGTAAGATGGLDARLAALEANDPACPRGYTVAADATMPAGATLCVRALAGGTRDEVVKVGRRNSAFWVDRYEASVNSAEDGSGMALFEADGVMGDLPRNGQWDRARAMAPAFALSRTGRAPARWITWFQANEACRASGKRLPTGDEWLAAARGTVDPGANDGTMNTNCNTMGMGARNAGGGAGCFSGAGAQDMIGNAPEWTAEWVVAPSTTETGFAATYWPEGYNNDSLVNVRSAARVSGTTLTSGLPVSLNRGGAWTDRTSAGVFSIDAAESPAHQQSGIGFRCVIPR